MNDPLPRHLKLARSLALASTLALGACVGAPESDSAAPPAADDGSGDLAEGAGLAPVSPLTLAEPTMPDAGAADADVPDTGKLSGPLPPPEMPESFA